MDSSLAPNPFSEPRPESFILICDDLNRLYTLRQAGGHAQTFSTMDQALDYARGLIREATFITYHDARGILVKTCTLWPDGTKPRAE